MKLWALRCFTSHIEVLASHRDCAVPAKVPVPQPKFPPADAAETVWSLVFDFWKGWTAFGFATMLLRQRCRKPTAGCRLIGPTPKLSGHIFSPRRNKLPPTRCSLTQLGAQMGHEPAVAGCSRSEERRVGKECR